eukprot:gb/GECG01011877.1/.p1 GENE.gb/GECG01011877.1/~~gb/GECG01011877.1/.p1  ORF type:complete len:176 (+),score=19.79 gb/GECG01011877.1/:1-528(+)
MEWKGLIRVNKSTVKKFQNSPLIKDLHMKHGTTSIGGGFIVQHHQKFFTVEQCSSTGVVIGQKGSNSLDFHGGGGICGEECGADGGEIVVRNCHSSGPITVVDGGGICGRKVAARGGKATITNCHSRGEISANSAGGIVGSSALQEVANCPSRTVTRREKLQALGVEVSLVTALG